MKTSIEILKKVKIALPAIPGLGIYLKRIKPLSQKDNCTPCLLQYYL